jgi:hypothetical protein
VEAGRLRVPALSPGGTFQASFVTAAFGGDNRYRVAVDPPGDTDADMTNNAAEVGLVVAGLADLAVPAAPAVSDAAPRQGRPVTLGATVVNRGIATARDVLVDVLARPLGGGSAFSVGSTRLAAVAPLSSQGVSISLDLSSLLGQYDLVVLVNGPGDVLEADDTNNTSPATRIEVRAGARATVIGRHLFYNNSSTGEAIASDKSALLPGGAAGFANVSSFVRGINAIAIDVADLPPGSALTADDFTFATGNGGDPGTWSAAPLQPTVTVRRGAGEGGSDRIILVWPDNSIRNTWLRVTVKSNDNTGLSDPDVFCFGNLVGESGDSPATLRVNALDLAAVKRALNSTSSVTGKFDFNRDGRVNALDLAAVKQNLNRNLPLVTPFSAAPVLPAAVVHEDVDEDRWNTGPATLLL